MSDNRGYILDSIFYNLFVGKEWDRENVEDTFDKLFGEKLLYYYEGHYQFNIDVGEARIRFIVEENIIKNVYTF